jgi:hypothetical protein
LVSEDSEAAEFGEALDASDVEQQSEAA